MRDTVRIRHLLVFFVTTLSFTKAVINVATEKPASQSSTEEQNVARYAVDGNISTCSVTQKSKKYAWWEVDLQTIYLVQSVSIQTKSTYMSSKNLAGYFISVLDGENEANYTTCYDYGTPEALPDVEPEQNVNCSTPIRGRYVKISQSRENPPYPANYSKNAKLELCEIQIFVDASQVATGKTARQSSLFAEMFSADNAVDGRKGDEHMKDCSHTSVNKKEAWWRVDLGKLYLIQSILIYPRPRNISEVQGRFAGFSLSVSKNKNENYQVCFNYGKNRSMPDLTVRHIVNCYPPVPGRYVKVSNSRNNPPYGLGYSKTAFVNLCEVEIIAEDCQSCCKACKDGFYGVKCQHPCPIQCGDNGSCSQRSGHCESCKPGYYGADCTMICSTNCVGNICSFDNGYCENCNGSDYGPSCNISCPSRCASCKSQNECTECDRNWYGNTCQKSCKNCGNGLCDQLDGKCINKFCKVGYFTDYCNESCSTNCKGGSSCLFPSGMCSACNDGHFGGYCENDCKPRCKLCSNLSVCAECNTDFYGENCDKKCPPCGGNGSCHIVSGLCSSHSCRVGFYGNDRKCSKNCSANCGGNGECSVIEGTCVNGCKAGWKGPFCTTEDGSSMTIAISGVLGGLVIILGSISMIYIIWRRRRRRNNDSTICMSQCENSGTRDNTYATFQTSNNQQKSHQRNETPTEHPRNTINEGESYYEECYEYENVIENPNANGQQTQCVDGEENVYMSPREDPDSGDHMYTALQSSNN